MLRETTVSRTLLESLRLAAIASLLLGTASVVADDVISWRGGDVTYADMDAQSVRAALDSVAAEASAQTANGIGQSKHSTGMRDASFIGTSVRHVIVRFSSPVDPETRDTLEVAGVLLNSYLGGNAFFASVSADADTDLAASLGVLSGVYDVDADWKQHPMFIAAETPTWAVVGEEEGDAVIGAYVLFHSDIDLLTDGVAAASLHGADVRDFIESVNGLVIELPMSAVSVLAADDRVQWIEPALPRLGENNDSNRTITEAALAQGAPYNLTGSGVGVLVYDGGTALNTHVDFQGRLTVRDASGTASHATHVSGTIGGGGVANATYKGMAPGVTLQSYGLETDGTGIFLYTNPGDFEDDYNESINTFGTDIANNSIGSNTETNGFPCMIQGDYGVMEMTIDQVVRGSLGAPTRVVWANGNERQGNRCDLEGFGDYYSTAPPATAKNHMTVGALNSNDDSMTTFSSWGPTDDGRMKPDISTAGCQSTGDGGVTSCTSSSTTAYAVACGTSMASPTACGLAALLLQDFRVQFPALGDFRNSLLRAFFAHTAQDRGNTGPDYQFGYGSVRIKQAIDFMRLGQFTDQTVDQGGTRKFTVSVPGGASLLKVTMAWDDYPGTPNVFGSLINDLDLRVFNPSGVQVFPWTLNPSSPSTAAVQNAANRRDNIEQVLVNSPVAGMWRVEVYGYNVPQGPQTFSICSSHALTSPASLLINLPDGTPTSMSPNTSPSVNVQITGVGDSVVGGTERLYFRYNGGAWLNKSLTPLGGGNYSVSLPPAVCGATPQFYFSAQGSTSGVITNPLDAPTSFYSATVGTKTVVFSDNFQTNLGWTVANTSLTDGPWERAVPLGVGDRGDPLDDYDGSGFCYVTDNAAGNSDIDGGPTRVTSPTINLGGGQQYTLRYARSMANDDFDIDRLLIEISNNSGGSWTTLENLNNTSGWGLATFNVNSVIAPTATMQLRFSATDNPNDSIAEAAMDAVEFSYTTCSGAFADCNTNGIVDSDDIASGRSADANTNGVPDECEPGCTPPSVSGHPSSLTRCVGTSATFTVTAGGTAPLSYQWRKNTVNIGGATSSSYTIPSVALSDAGSFDCVVTNACGSATSNAATLTVSVAPSISLHPANQTVCAGQPASFSVTASGTATLSYQWRKNTVNIGGATNSTYNIAATVTGDAGSYDCVVTNACGSATSNAATLTVNTPPSISSHPANQTVCAGQPASFSVTAGGTAPLSYQWRKNTVNIGGATNSTYIIASTVTGDAGSYDCVVTNACGSATSNAATLTVNTAPSISSHPANQTVCAGQPASFSVTATGTAPLSYQWRKNTVNIGGATNSTYNIAATVTGDAGSYDCIVTNACGSATSNAATLTVNTGPSISSHPANQSVCEGQPASFSVTASGTAPLSYQWRKSTVNIGGATNSTYNIAATVTGDAGSYDCVVTNACGSATSNVATLTVNTGPSISSHPANQSVCEGQPASFSVTASGTAPLSYQWRKNTINIGGATNSTYNIAATVTGDAGSYDCVVTNACGSATSNAATLTVNTGPSISSHPANQSVCEGQPTSFSVTASGTAPLSYQWRRNTVNIGGATNSTYNIASTVTGDAGSYDCVVTNACGSATSNAASLTVNDGPSISVHPANDSTTLGGSASFSVTASGTAPLTYQWRKGGLNLSDGGSISGATTPTLTINPVAFADAGTYDVVVSNLCGSIDSDDASLTVGCEPCDTNCDGSINPFDIQPFLDLLSGAAACSPCAGDANANGTINPFDITPFLDCLSP